MKKINPAWAIAFAAVVLLVAVFLNRPVKVSILENVFIEVGDGAEGPPEFYEKAVVLEDGRTVYLSNGGCRVKAAEE
ncbi:MAG: hypothetical protein GY906_08650 [bacterium]|nr:hypothetical protein [bacterium]